MAIDINQATQPIIMAALASESGTIQEKTQRFTRGMQNVGAAISRKFSGKYANRLAFNRTKDKVNAAIQKAAEDYESKLYQKEMNNFAQGLRKEYGKDWMKNAQAMREYEDKRINVVQDARQRAEYAVRENAQGGLPLDSPFGLDPYVSRYNYEKDANEGAIVHATADAIDAELYNTGEPTLEKVSADLKKKDLKGIGKLDQNYIKRQAELERMNRRSK